MFGASAGCTQPAGINIRREWRAAGHVPAERPAGMWRDIASVIERWDTNCRGIVVLGLEAPEAELAASFKKTAGVDLVKGFMVGRTLWAQPAADWLAGKCDDAAVVERVSAAFGRLVEAWRGRNG